MFLLFSTVAAMPMDVAFCGSLDFTRCYEKKYRNMDFATIKNGAINSDTVRVYDMPGASKDFPSKWFLSISDLNLKENSRIRDGETFCPPENVSFVENKQRFTICADWSWKYIDY